MSEGFNQGPCTVINSLSVGSNTPNPITTPPPHYRSSTLTNWACNGPISLIASESSASQGNQYNWWLGNVINREIMYPTPTLTEMEAHKHQLWTGYIWVNKSHSRRDQWTEPFALINPFALIDPFISPHWLHRLLNPFMNWNGVFSHPTSDIT